MSDMAMEKGKLRSTPRKAAARSREVVLLTGAGGFIGQALSKALARDYVVAGLDRHAASLPAAASLPPGCFFSRIRASVVKNWGFSG